MAFITVLCCRVNVVYIDRDGSRHEIKGKVGDNALYLAHRYGIEMEGGNDCLEKAGCVHQVIVGACAGVARDRSIDTVANQGHKFR